VWQCAWSNDRGRSAYDPGKRNAIWTISRATTTISNPVWAGSIQSAATTTTISTPTRVWKNGATTAIPTAVWIWTTGTTTTTPTTAWVWAATISTTWPDRLSTTAD